MKSSAVRFSVYFFAVATLIGASAQSQDLESLLDSAETAPAKAPGETEKAPAMAVESPLAFAIRKSIGAVNAEQRLFLRYVDAAQWDRAVLQFPMAFEGTEFQKSPTGRAIFGLVEFKAGLPMTGLQTLFMASNPKEIIPHVTEEWRKMVNAENNVWDLAKVEWNPAWGELFDESVGQRLQVAAALAIPNNSENLLKLSKSLPTDSAQKMKVDWQLVIDYSVADKADQAGKMLANLMKSSKSPVSRDLMQITAARLLFQNAYYDAAIKYYEKVPKKSEYWMEAQEEIGWSFIRKGEPNNAMAITHSLVRPDLQYQVSPEAYFIRSLAQLKVCDYPGTIESLKVFPKVFKQRTTSLTSLSENADTPEVNKALSILQSRKANIVDLGKGATLLPRRIFRDEILYRAMQSSKDLENEARIADQLYAKSLALTGLQGSLEALQKAARSRVQSERNLALQRVKQLATEEVSETKEILRKLHIVEAEVLQAEVLQQVSIAEKIVHNTSSKIADDKKGTTGYKGTANLVRYPAEDELWFDEISSYRVDIKKACTVKR